MNLIKKRSVQTGLAVVFALCLLLGAHLTGIIAPFRTVDTTSMEDIPYHETIGGITKIDEIQQDFLYEEDCLESFTVRVATFGALKDSHLFVSLTNLTTKEKIQDWSIETKNLADNAFHTFTLAQKQQDISGHIFYIQISADAESAQAVTLWKSAQNLYEGDLFVNQNLQDGQLLVGFNMPQTTNFVNYFYVFIIMCGILLLLLWLISDKPWLKWKQWCISKFGILKQERKNVFAFVAVEIMLLFLSFILEKCISKYNLILPNTVGAFNEYRFAFIFVCLSAVALFCFTQKYLVERPEIMVLFMLLGVGSLYVFCLPSEVIASWDEAIHYLRSVTLSHCFSGQANIGELMLKQIDGLQMENYREISQLSFHQNLFEELYRTGAMTPIPTEPLSRIWTICYIPSAIALWIGRLLQLPYTIVFSMGAFSNLLLYTSLVYFAVRKVKSGKMIVTAIAFMTTTVFLASRYSYDTWVIGFYILGISYFLSAMQTEGKVSKKDLIVMWAALFFGTFAKAVYFLIIGCLLFLPKGKFRSRKQHVLFKILVLVSMGTLAAGMILPFIVLPFIFMILYGVCYGIYLLIRKMSKKQIIAAVAVFSILVIIVGLYAAFNIIPGMLGEGDIRGGAVNASAQFLNILNHPIHYLNILFKFIFKDYLSFNSDLGWTTSFNSLAYVGFGSLRHLPAILLIVVALTDKNRFDCWKNQWKVRVCMSVLIFVTICLMATALYIDFTPFGLNQINGCQPRYLIPLLYPFFSLIGSSKLQNPLNRKWYNGAVIGISSVTVLVNLWGPLVSTYF